MVPSSFAHSNIASYNIATVAPKHVGAGRSPGIVDLTIARDEFGPPMLL